MEVNTVVSLVCCPFCGSEDVTVGPNDCTSWAVRCECGAKMVDRMPSSYTKKEHKFITKIRKEKGISDLDAMAVFHMLKVVERWNERKY